MHTETSLTPEEEQFILDWYKEHPMPEQDENGVDIGHLRENLRLTPLERLEKMERHMKAVLQTRKAMRISQTT